MFHAPLPVLIKTRHACGHLVKEAIIGDPYEKQQVINHKRPWRICSYSFWFSLSFAFRSVCFRLQVRRGSTEDLACRLPPVTQRAYNRPLSSQIITQERRVTGDCVGIEWDKMTPNWLGMLLPQPLWRALSVVGVDFTSSSEMKCSQLEIGITTSCYLKHKGCLAEQVRKSPNYLTDITEMCSVRYHTFLHNSSR